MRPLKLMISWLDYEDSEPLTIFSHVKGLETGFGLVIRFVAHLELGIMSNYNAAQITRTHTSLLSFLQHPLVVALLHSSNMGYSSYSYGSRTAFPNLRLKAIS
jgi:hypothetical protein